MLIYGDLDHNGELTKEELDKYLDAHSLDNPANANKQGGLYFTEEQKATVSRYSNVTVHGAFRNPDDLPEIYSKIDFVISTYDSAGVNVQYAESNKIYEAMFFETPIIVSTNTILEKKVNQYNMGFAVNALDDRAVTGMIDSITEDLYLGFRDSLKSIDKSESVNDNTAFFRMLKEQLS